MIRRNPLKVEFDDSQMHWRGQIDHRTPGRAPRGCRSTVLAGAADPRDGRGFRAAPCPFSPRHQRPAARHEFGATAAKATTGRAPVAAPPSHTSAARAEARQLVRTSAAAGRKPRRTPKRIGQPCKAATISEATPLTAHAVRHAAPTSLLSAGDKQRHAPTLPPLCRTLPAPVRCNG